MLFQITIAIIVLAVISAVAFAKVRIGQLLRGQAQRLARETFSWRREWLEADFHKLAGQRGIPRGLAWVDCDFENNVQFAKDRATGHLRALVAVTIRFEAIEGGGMEDVEAVGLLRAATAIFFYDGKKWTTSGRALFNLNPSEAIVHYRHELETVD